MIVSVASETQQFRYTTSSRSKSSVKRLGYSSESVRKFENRGSRPSSGFSNSLAGYLGLTGERAAELVSFLRRAPADHPQRVLDWIAELADPARAARAPTNLPSPLTRMVGRSEEVAQHRAVLASSDVRLLTFVGFGPEWARPDWPLPWQKRCAMLLRTASI